MVRIYELDQNSSEWDKLRLGKFTASDAQAIGNDGKGLETLVYKKVAEIMTQQIEESYMNSDMQRGHDFEAMARNAYEIETGKRVVQVGFVEMNSYVGCSPDGLVGEDGLAEYKNLNGANYIKALY
jgi:predicted phage-related endonuclease